MGEEEKVFFLWKKIIKNSEHLIQSYTIEINTKPEW